MSGFPTAGHLASWAGRCPGNDQSAGQRRSGRTRKGSKGLGIALEEAALAATRTKKTYLAAQYQRLRLRIGHGRALGAVKHRRGETPAAREYALDMDPLSTGQLVKVAEDGPERDGIVFETPSAQKVVVAVMDRRRGPVFRTVHRRTLSERAEAGPDDAALNRLIRRTPPPGRRGARAGAGTGRGQDGHTRTATHRTTGK